MLITEKSVTGGLGHTWLPLDACIGSRHGSPPTGRSTIRSSDTRCEVDRHLGGKERSLPPASELVANLSRRDGARRQGQMA